MPDNIEVLISLFEAMKDTQLSDDIKDLLKNLSATGLSKNDIQKLKAQLQDTLDNLAKFHPDLTKVKLGAEELANYEKFSKLAEEAKPILDKKEEELGLPALMKERDELDKKIAVKGLELDNADASQKQKLKDELKALQKRYNTVRSQTNLKIGESYQERDAYSLPNERKHTALANFNATIPEHESVAKDDYRGRLHAAGDTLQNGENIRRTSDAVGASLNTLRDVLQKSELTESGRQSVQKVFQLMEGTQKAFTSSLLSPKLSSLKKQVDAMSRGESDSAEFKNFRTALTEALKVGGDMKKLYDMADVYALEKTKNGNPSSLGGKNRLEAARKVKSVLKDVVQEQERAAANEQQIREPSGDMSSLR